MKFAIDIKPLSVNRAWQGRRFSTREKKKYEEKLLLLLPRKMEAGPYYRVHFDFHIKNCYRIDIDNLFKVTIDCIVKKGIIKDDRFIKKISAEKFESSNEGFGVEITSIDK